MSSPFFHRMTRQAQKGHTREVTVLVHIVSALVPETTDAVWEIAVLLQAAKVIMLAAIFATFLGKLHHYSRQISQFSH